MTEKVTPINKDVERQMREAAHSELPSPAFLELRRLCSALDALKAVDPADLARLEMVDGKGHPLTCERLLDTLRAEMAWVRMKVQGERMKIVRGKK